MIVIDDKAQELSFRIFASKLSNNKFSGRRGIWAALIN